MGLFSRRRDPKPKRLARVVVTHRQEIYGESRFQGEIERFKLAWGRKVFASLVWDESDRNAPSPVQVYLSSGDDWTMCGWLPARDVALWEPTIRTATSRGDVLFCDADIRGGWESAPAYGVWLVPERKG